MTTSVDTETNGLGAVLLINTSNNLVTDRATTVTIIPTNINLRVDPNNTVLEQC